MGVRRTPPWSPTPPGRRAQVPVLLVSAWLLVAGLTGCTSLGDAPARDAASPSDASGLPENLDPNPPASIPAFDTTSVAGALVDGFPADTVPVPPDARILASSAADVEGTPFRQVTLNLSSPASVQEILDFYATAMTSAAFAAQPGGAQIGRAHG